MKSLPRLPTIIISLSTLLAFTPVTDSFARGGGHSSGGQHRASYSTTAARNSHGRIKRSSSARNEFKRETGYAHGRPGYVVDHVIPLKRGGQDATANMQWQTKAAAKSKDKWE